MHPQNNEDMLTIIPENGLVIHETQMVFILQNPSKAMPWKLHHCYIYLVCAMVGCGQKVTRGHKTTFYHDNKLKMSALLYTSYVTPHIGTVDYAIYATD